MKEGLRGERRVVVRARRSQVNNMQQYDHYHNNNEVVCESCKWIKFTSRM